MVLFPRRFGLLARALPLLFLLSEVQGDCGKPDTPNFATVKNGTLKKSYPVGTVLKYECIPGYQNIPGVTPSIQCLDNSTWSEIPEFCRAKKCRPPTLDNGRVTAQGDLSLGDTVTFSCVEGYRLIGQKTTRCVVSHNTVDWSPSPPTCHIIPCFPPPKIANGSHSGDADGDYVYGTAVTYKCDRDFTLIGKATISCMVAENGVDGKWSGPAPECKVVKCKRPEISNGKLSGIFQATYPYDHGILIECNAGYTLNGSNHIKCGANSLWHPAVPNCVKPKKCRPPTLDNGRVTAQGDLSLGDTVTFSCVEGYRLIGPKTSRCAVSGDTVDWSPSPPTCHIIPCFPPPKIANGSHSGDADAGYVYGTVVTYKCDPEFTLIGKATISCTVAENGVDGKWSGPAPECKGSGNTVFAIGQLTLILAILVLIV